MVEHLICCTVRYKHLGKVSLLGNRENIMMIHVKILLIF